MPRIALTAALCLVFSSPLAAADTSCGARAAEMKLSGAALTSFMTKCEREAKAGCEKQSVEKRLTGAAKNSFEEKCLRDAVGRTG